PTQVALVVLLGGCPVAQLLVVGRAISGNSLLVTAKGALVVPGGVLPGVTKNTGLDGLSDQGLGVQLGEVDASAALDHSHTLQEGSPGEGVLGGEGNGLEDLLARTPGVFHSTQSHPPLRVTGLRTGRLHLVDQEVGGGSCRDGDVLGRG